MVLVPGAVSQLLQKEVTKSPSKRGDLVPQVLFAGDDESTVSSEHRDDTKALQQSHSFLCLESCTFDRSCIPRARNCE